jgi:MFS family permease
MMRKALVITAALIIVAWSGHVSSLTFPTTSIGVNSDVLLWRSQASSSTHSAFPTTTTRHLLRVNKSPQIRSKTELANSSIEDDEEDELSDEMKKNVIGPLTLLLISQFLLFIGVGAVIPSIPLYGKELGFSSAANGIVISAPAVALLLFSRVGGKFADQARKPAMIIGMAVIAVSDLGTALAPGLGTLLVARLGLGAGRCISESGERGLLADLANQIPALRGRALAAQQACVALGIAVGAPLGGIVVENYGPRAAFLCVTAAASVACILYFFLPETQQRAAEEDDDDDNKSDSALSAPANADWGDLLSENQWRGLALCQCGASFGFAAKIASIPILAAATLPGGAIGSGALLSAAGLSGLIGAPIGGWLTDQAGAKTTAILSGVFSAISLMLIPIALGMPSSSLDDSLSVTLGDVVLSGNALAFTVVVLGWSLGTSAQGPALAALAQKSAPLGAEATAMALPKAAGDGTYIVAPFLLGLVTDAVFNTPGIECAAAGSATLLGVLALAVLGYDVETTALPTD